MQRVSTRFASPRENPKALSSVAIFAYAAPIAVLSVTVEPPESSGPAFEAHMLTEATDPAEPWFAYFTSKPLSLPTLLIAVTKPRLPSSRRRPGKVVIWVFG